MLSVLSTTSTVKAPMSLDGVNEIFFQATLEYLYTAEESMKEAFEFLYEDRVAADEGPEIRKATTGFGVHVAKSSLCRY
jgi:hypothetical protein